MMTHLTRLFVRCGPGISGEPLEEVGCFKYLGSQVAADVRCEKDVVHLMNEVYRAWGALKRVLSNNKGG